MQREICSFVYHSNAASLFEMSKAPSHGIPTKFFANQLANLQSFIVEALSDDDIPFVQKVSGSKRMVFDPTPLASRYFYATPGFIDLVRMLSPKFEFSEHINAFSACCKTMGLLDQPFSFPELYLAGEPVAQLHGRSAAEIFNTLVANIRTLCQSRKVNDRLRNRERNAEDCFITYRNYVDSLFASTPRLAILQLNLYCESDDHEPDHHAVQMAARNLDHLLANQRCNRLFKDQKGYIAKLEFGDHGSAYWHILLFFDGSKSEQLINLPTLFGEYWAKVITKGRGGYRYHHEKYIGRKSEPAILIVNAGDASKRALFLEHLAYLCKSSQYLKFKPAQRIKPIRKGQAPRAR